MDGKLTQYLDSVCVEIIDAASHQGIRDELTDHFYCLVDTYLDMEHSEEYAIDRALADLGSAQIIGKKLNNIHTPSVKWIVAWAVFWLISTVGIITNILYNHELTSFILLSSVAIDFVLLHSYVRFLYKVVIKKESLPFIRFNKPTNNTKSPPTYVEKLTNRVFAIIGLIFAGLIILGSVFSVLEGDYNNFGALISGITFTSFMIKGVIQIYCSIKHPIIMMTKTGFIMAGGMIKELKWKDIENYYFKTDYKGTLMLTLKPRKGYTLRIPCLDIDRDKIRDLFNQNEVLRKA